VFQYRFADKHNALLHIVAVTCICGNEKLLFPKRVHFLVYIIEKVQFLKTDLMFHAKFSMTKVVQ